MAKKFVHRNAVRRKIAYISLAVSVAVIVGSVAAGLYSDPINARVVQLTTWLTFAVGGLLGLVGAYMGLGSWENRAQINAIQGQKQAGGVETEKPWPATDEEKI